MINLEKLDLHLELSRNRGFVDGNNLKENIVKHMTQLNQFTFYIHTCNYSREKLNALSNEDIQRTFDDFLVVYFLLFV